MRFETLRLRRLYRCGDEREGRVAGDRRLGRDLMAATYPEPACAGRLFALWHVQEPDRVARYRNYLFDG